MWNKKQKKEKEKKDKVSERGANCLWTIEAQMEEVRLAYR